MAKATKTWKIGERAKGGVITVEINGKIVSIIGKEWDTSKGYSKASNQSNAKEFTRGTLDSTERDSHWKIDSFLCDLTSSYFADTITKWIETKVTLNKNW